MSFFTDLLRSLYDFKGLGCELSRRRPARVVGTLLVLSCLYGVMTGSWYAASAGELAAIIAQEVKLRLPTMTIEQGKLSSAVEQPFIVTDQDLSPPFFPGLQAWALRWFHWRLPIPAIRVSPGETSAQAFCFVLDTTGTYQTRIHPEDYELFFVLTQDFMRVSGERRSGGMREVREIRFADSKTQAPAHIDPSRIDTAAVTRAVRKICTGWFSVISLIASLIRFSLKSLLVALVGLAVGAVAKKRLSFGQAYAIAVYALVPVVVLALLRVMVAPYPGILVFLAHFLYGVVPVLSVPPTPTPEGVSP